MLDVSVGTVNLVNMKTLFALLATTLIAAAQAPNPPTTVRPSIGIGIAQPGIAQIDPATGLPVQPPFGQPGEDLQPITEMEEFFGPGRYQLTPAQIVVDGKTVSVVMKIDTINGQVWHLQWTQNTLGKITAKFVEVEGLQMRPRPGFGGPGAVGGFGFPGGGGVINPVPFREGGPAGITTQPGRPPNIEPAPPALPSPRPKR